MASSRSSSSSGQVIPLSRWGSAPAISLSRLSARAMSLPRLRGRVGWGPSQPWRRRHETTAVVRTTLERDPSPSSAFLDGEPTRITLAVDRRPRYERSRAGPWRLQRRSVYLASAPFDADPRRGQSRRWNATRIVNADGVAYYRAQAHPNAASRANAHPLIDP